MLPTPSAMGRLLYGVRVPALVCALLTTVPLPALGEEPCEAVAGINIAGTPALTFHDPYSPFEQTGLSEVISVTLTNGSPAACDLTIIFTTDDDSGRLRSGGETLTYALETLAGAPLLRPASTIDPQAGAHISLTLPPGQGTTISLRGRVAPAQVVAPGLYTDGSTRIRVYRSPQDGDFGALLTESSFPVSANVAGVCTMSAPEPDSINFSDDIGADGRPFGAARALQLSEAACNTAAELSLSGAPLAHQAGSQFAGFDSFINFEAQASFGSVSTVLTTAQAGQTEETVSVPATGMGSAPVDVSVRLLAGRALAAGIYSGVLTITLEPLP